jgi:hypothetical protein
MAIEYPVKMCVTLEPVGQPWVNVDMAGRGRIQQLTETTDFEFEFDTDSDLCCLTVEHFKKDDHDPTTAVIVKEISFFGIHDPRFVWQGIYYPEYPQHYSNKKSPLPGQGYLGWNGTYQLEFTIPVFTWIHKVQNLGWIYG